MNEVKNPFGRALKERSAAQYLDRSMSWLCNGRRSDAARILEGKSPMFPPHIKQGRNIYYLKEDIDAWLDTFK